MRRALALLAAFLVLGAATAAASSPDAGPPAAATVDAGPADAGQDDSYTHVHSSFHVTTQAGNAADFPPSLIVPESVWTKIDAEIRRLQAQETRLTAENTSLTSSLKDAGTGWGTVAAIAGALVLGTLGAKYVF